MTHSTIVTDAHAVFVDVATAPGDPNAFVRLHVQTFATQTTDGAQFEVPVGALRSLGTALAAATARLVAPAARRRRSA